MATGHADDTVYAAGCVLWRPAGGGTPRPGAVELCLVHRPRYDDWSHPKGKLEPGEETRAAALREVLEETGHRCETGDHLGTVRYTVTAGPKQVDYWAARDLGGIFTPNHEVDEVRWLSPGDAKDLLTQPRDRFLVDSLVESLHRI